MEIIAFEARVQDNAVLICIVGRESITVFLRTAIDTQLMALLDSRTQHGILPISTFSQSSYLFIGITSLITEIVLLVLCPLTGIKQVQLFSHITDTQSVMIINVGLTLTQFTFLSSNENHTVGTTRAIDSCGRHIFQHLNTFNIIRVNRGQGVQTALDSTDTGGIVGSILKVDKTINHIERFVGRIHRVAATNTDMTVGTWLSATCSDSQTCYLSA